MNKLMCGEPEDASDSEYNEVEHVCKIPMVYDYSFGTIGGNCSDFKARRGFYRFGFYDQQNYDFTVKKLRVVNSRHGVVKADESFFQ